MSNIEQLEQRRRNIMLHMAGSAVVMGSAFVIVAQGHSQLPQTIEAIAIFTMLGTAVYFLTQAVRLFRLLKLLHDNPELESVLNDEFTRIATMRATSVAFFVVIGLQALFIILHRFGIVLQAGTAPVTTIMVGVVTLILAMRHYEEA